MLATWVATYGFIMNSLIPIAFASFAVTAQSTIEGVMKYLGDQWVPARSTDYKSMGPRAITDEPELLSITFARRLTGPLTLSAETRIIVARVSDNNFSCWRYCKSEDKWGTAPAGRYETPSLGAKTSEIEET